MSNVGTDLKADISFPNKLQQASLQVIFPIAFWKEEPQAVSEIWKHTDRAYEIFFHGRQPLTKVGSIFGRCTPVNRPCANIVKIFANCLVKNEADIIEETLRHASGWCDRIFVFDNGSTDGTWELVQRVAKYQPQVVPFKSSAVPFSNSLRAETFRDFRHEAATGDWWCTLDADEIYIDDPRRFLSAVPARHHVVWGVYFQHYFTDIDASRYAADPTAYPPHTPAELALRYYRCDYSEARFFRYRPGLVWNHGSAPRHLGVVHPRRIRFKHYQYRSPDQIALRLRTRQQAIASGCENFADYCSETDWRLKIVPVSTCRHADDPGAYAIEEANIPPHIESPLHRSLKFFMHGIGVWA